MTNLHRTRAHETADENVAGDADGEHQIVVGGLAQERYLEEVGHAELQKRNVVERHRPLGKLDPVDGDEADDLREADSKTFVSGEGSRLPVQTLLRRSGVGELLELDSPRGD